MVKPSRADSDTHTLTNSLCQAAMYKSRRDRFEQARLTGLPGIAYYCVAVWNVGPWRQNRVVEHAFVAVKGGVLSSSCVPVALAWFCASQT